MTQAGFEAINEAKRNGKWYIAYSSEIASTIPMDLAKALRQDEVAWKNFKIFSSSTKLQYIYWVMSAKKKLKLGERESIVLLRELPKILSPHNFELWLSTAKNQHSQPVSKLQVFGIKCK